MDISILLTREYENTRWNTIAALIRGIQDRDRIQRMLKAEIDHQQRQDVIAHLNQQKRRLREYPELTVPIEELEQLPNQDTNNKPNPVFLDEDGNAYERSSVDNKIQELTTGSVAAGGSES